MPWLQLTFETTPDDAEQLSNLLSDAGASAVTFLDSADQPLYEPPVGETPLWSRTRVMGLFDAATDINSHIVDKQVTQIFTAFIQCGNLCRLFLPSPIF